MPDSALPVTHGRHYDLIKKAIPQHLIDAVPASRAALKQIKPRIHDWYITATAQQKNALKTLLQARVIAQGRLDKTLSRLQPLNDFAQPLLAQALKTAGFTLPVDDVFLRLYRPTVDAFGLKTGGFSSVTLSLLQAALHNFEQPETEANYFGSGSGFITPPDNQGRFEPYATTLKIETFASICRQLDIGEQYQQHLHFMLNPQSPVSQGPLYARYPAQQKAMLRADAQIALLKGDINDHAHEVLMRVVNGERAIKTGEQQVWYRYPCVLGLMLKGCVVFDLCVKGQYSDALIVWIPGDPEHPLKGYASYFDFRDELLRKLTPTPSSPRRAGLTAYQQFLSQFIAQKDRPYYYKRLTEQVIEAPGQPRPMEWFRAEKIQFLFRVAAPLRSLLLRIPPNPEGHARRVQALLPSINIEICTMSGDRAWVDVELWQQQFQDMRSRAFGNARNMAIPTADADANNHAERLSHYLNIGLFAVNLVSLVVPPLGEVMMVVMAGQLLYETIEGIEEWSDGDKEAAWAHLSDVLDNLATLAAGAVVLQGVVMPAIEQLKVVTLPGGAQRLWNSDLSPYEHAIDIPAHSVANEAGLHRIKGQDVLPHQGNVYVLKKDPVGDHYRAVHPRQPDAYQPEFRHNGHGVWVHEGEQPATWERLTLLRRLGPSVDGLSDRELEQVLSVSGIEDDDLRRMYAENQPTPVLLSDNIRAFKAYAKADMAVAEVRAGRISDELCSYAAAFTVELPGWPATMAIDLLEPPPSQVQATRYGHAAAQGSNVIRISRAALMQGELPGRVVDALDPQQRATLLGGRVLLARESLADAFKEHLSEQMGRHSLRLFNSLYEGPSIADDAERLPVELLKRVFPSLPTLAARRLVAQAGGTERDLLSRGKVPARMMQTARVWQRDARLSAAYRGLYLDGLTTTDTEALVLNSLDNVPGWQNQLRLEIRNDSVTGELRAAFGPGDAAQRKIMVRVGDGQYRAHDDRGNELNGTADLYASLQHALPDQHRLALKLPHVGQGADLRLTLQRYALPRARLQAVLKIKADSQPFFVPPRRMADGQSGYPLSGRGVLAAAESAPSTWLKSRLEHLYPTFTADDVQAFFDLHQSLAHVRISALEREWLELHEALRQWENAPIDGVPLSSLVTDSQRAVLRTRRAVHEHLIQAWRRTGPTHTSVSSGYEGQGLNLLLTDLGPVLETLPALPADFSHVSQLSLWSVGESAGIDRFLSHFKELRALHINQSSLTTLPPAIGRMPHLTVLDLKGNSIVLTPESAAQLKNLTQLRLINLDQSPLGLAPDISRMPYLKTVSLQNCGLDRWPVGVLAQPRSRTFKLMLEHNPLQHIPDVAPGSDKAGTLARTLLTRNRVADDVLAKYDLYGEAVGIDPDRQHPPRLEKGSRYWLAGMTADESEQRRALWNRVEESVGSEAFFNVLTDQARNLVYRRPEFKRDLQGKLWLMLEDMDESPELRDTLFEMASAPFTCVDAGAQLFNAMGVEVMVHEAYRGTEPASVGADILRVARGKARLDELGRIARARVQELEAAGRQHPQFDNAANRIEHRDASGRPVRDIDEVEIYLAYTSQLAQRLELPWQVLDMMFPEPDVTEALIESAYRRVQALEEGEGLRNQLLEQPIWRDYVQGAYASELAVVREKITALTELQTAQQAWVDEPDLSAQQRDDLRQTIERAARLLGKPASETAIGQVMSSEAYDADMRQLDDEQRQLLERLTDQALSPWQPVVHGLYDFGSSESD